MIDFSDRGLSVLLAKNSLFIDFDRKKIKIKELTFFNFSFFSHRQLKQKKMPSLAAQSL